ncbi:MAG: hypothetical protein H6907_16640 [Hyphomicrobiales bacterium]|nr:hypothetical protein [Hyphomicrobiales bacterium]MCP5373356.1 hypothetical protein [Hyphomicrobiales bacterium]
MRIHGLLAAGILFLAACQQTTSNQAARPATEAPPPAPAAAATPAAKTAAPQVADALGPNLDANGNLLVDGKPFFPLGIYAVPTNAIPAARDLGFNMVHTYSAEGQLKRRGSAKPIPWLLEFLGEAEAAGVKVAMGLPRYSVMHWNEKDLRDRVEALRHSPALVAWYMFDEPDDPGHKIPYQRLADMARLVDEVDGTRPRAIVVSNLAVALPRKDFDHAQIAMVDPYPYRTQNSDLYPVYKEITDARLATLGRKPLWPVLQLHGKGQGGTGYGYLEPPYRVLRNMTYQAIAAGARGLFYFTYTGSQFHLTKSPTGLENVRRLLAELNPLTPLFLAPDPARAPARVVAAGGTVSRVFEHDGSAWVLVVNTGRKVVGFTVRGTSGKLPARVSLPLEDRVLETVDGALPDRLEPLAVRLYRFRLGAPPTS